MRLRRRARARTRFGWARSERATVGLAAAAALGASLVVADQFGRLLSRRAAERRDDRERFLEAAPAAALDTVGVAVSGYAEAPRSETVLFNLLAGFLGSFALVRISTWGIRDRWWPLRDVRVRGHHIHHFVPGILLAFGSGIAALLVADDDARQRLAFPLGAGIGLTFDESALLLDLRDVYWTREGLLSVQVTFGASAILSAAIITLRMLRRGERSREEAGLIPPAPERVPPGTAALT